MNGVPFKPGDSKPANSGRKKGTPDIVPMRARDPGTATPRPKLAREVAARLEELGLDPITGLVRIGLEAEKGGELGIARLCYTDLASFVWPKRKAVEHTGSVDLNVSVHGNARSVLEDRVAGIAERLGTRTLSIVPDR